MKLITKRQRHKPMADSNPWAVRYRKAKPEKFNDKDLKRMSEFDNMLNLNHYDTGWNTSYGTGAYIEDEDDTSVMGNRFPRIYLVYFFLFSSYFVPVLHTSDLPETYMLLSCIILSCSR